MRRWNGLAGKRRGSCYTRPVPGPAALPSLPREPEVLIECPRFSFVKRRADGEVDFVSPLPCPYNYGCIPGMDSGDGDPLDVVVLGPRLPRGERRRMTVVGVIGFLDAGCGDPKVICSAQPLRPSERTGLELFFRVYARFKRVLHFLRRNRGETRFLGWLSGG